MVRSSDVNRRSTPILVEAGNVMRKLSLPSVTALYYIRNNETYIQQDIADLIGYTRSAISTCLQAMADQPLPLVISEGQSYTLTKDGRTVLTHVKGMLDRCGVDLQTVNWTNDAEIEKIADRLAPFGNARSIAPFLLLYSIGTRGALGDRIELHGTPQSVRLGDIVQDVKTRQQERGESATRKQIQQFLRRFDKADTIDYEDQKISLTEKGQEQANLLEQLIHMLESQNKTSVDGDVSTGTDPSQSSLTDSQHSDHSEAQAGSTRSINGRYGMDNIAQQNDPRNYLDSGRASLWTDQQSVHDSPAIIPAYCLRMATDDGSASDSDVDSQSAPSPVLPLTTLTLNELADRIGQLVGEYDGTVEFEPYWTLQTETGLQPLSPARLPLDEASFQAWQIVNNAHELWNDRSR